MERHSNYGRTEKEAVHNKLFFDLCNITEESKILGIPHIVYMGIQFFTQMAIDCAPNKKEALELINDTVKEVISKDKENN